MHEMDLRPDEHEEIRATVFWMLAEFCAEFRLPVRPDDRPDPQRLPGGRRGGRDLFDRRVSLHDYRELFNHFAGVTFPVSTLSPDAGAELVAYAWIFPNVLPMGHWWYSNIPAFIAADLKARLQAVPKDEAAWAITPTPTSSSSSCPSSTCTAGSWPRPWPRNACGAGAGRWTGPLSLASHPARQPPAGLRAKSAQVPSGHLTGTEREGMLEGRRTRSHRVQSPRANPPIRLHNQISSVDDRSSSRIHFHAARTRDLPVSGGLAACLALLPSCRDLPGQETPGLSSGSGQGTGTRPFLRRSAEPDRLGLRESGPDQYGPGGFRGEVFPRPRPGPAEAFPAGPA